MPPEPSEPSEPAGFVRRPSEGWDLAESREDPNLGEEGAMWTGQQYDLLSARTIMWRQGNLLLAAVGWGDWEPEEVRLIADQMADRAK